MNHPMFHPMFHPWQILLVLLSDIENREQQRTIEYLCTEYQVLKEKIGKKRIMLKQIPVVEKSID